MYMTSALVATAMFVSLLLLAVFPLLVLGALRASLDVAPAIREEFRFWRLDIHWLFWVFPAAICLSVVPVLVFGNIADLFGNVADIVASGLFCFTLAVFASGFFVRSLTRKINWAIKINKLPHMRGQIVGIEGEFTTIKTATRVTAKTRVIIRDNDRKEHSFFSSEGDFEISARVGKLVTVFYTASESERPREIEFMALTKTTTVIIDRDYLSRGYR